MSFVIGVLGAPRSPGASTLALAMGCVVPAATVVESDPSGGRIALSHGIPGTPGLVEFAVRVSSGHPQDPMQVRTRVLECGAKVVPAPLDGLAVTGAVGRMAGLGPHLPSATGGSVLLDLGRAVSGHDVRRELLAGCDALVLVSRCDVVSLGLAKHLVTVLLDYGRPAGLALVHEGLCEPESSADILGLPLFGVLPHKVRHAERLWRPGAPQTPRNNLIVKAAGEILNTVTKLAAVASGSRERELAV